MSSKQHSELAPSASDRWIHCSGSILLPSYEEERDTTAADEGTLAHSIAECRLLADEWFDYKDEIEKLKADPLYFKEMDSYIDQYVDYINSKSYDKRYIEELIDLSYLQENLFGTADCILLNSEPSVEVVDFKFGRMKVSPEKNTQLMLYALGAARLLQKDFPGAKDFPITLTIFQPRINNISSWSISWSGLSRWSQNVLIPALSKINFDVIEQNPGDWCRFCPSRIFCREYNNIYLDVDPGKPDSMSDTEIEELLSKLEDLDKYIKTVKGYITTGIKDGKHFNNYKLVAGRKTRSWDNDGEAISAFKQDGIDCYELATPAKMEKRIGRKLFNEKYSCFVKSTTGNPVLVKRDDKREELSFEN